MVDIITPPNQRLELVEQFSKYGKHILMEKPIERTLENAKSIVSICENNKVNLGIVFQHRFRKSSIKLKSLINENKFGQIFQLKSIFHGGENSPIMMNQVEEHTREMVEEFL